MTTAMTAAANLTTVAVYGTLRPGDSNFDWCLRRPAVHVVGRGSVTGHRLVGAGRGFPYAVASGDPADEIVVDVVTVDADAWPGVLADLDRLEGYPVHYLRRPVPVALDDGDDLIAWLYYVPDDDSAAGLPPIPSGDWFADDARPPSLSRIPSVYRPHRDPSPSTIGSGYDEGWSTPTSAAARYCAECRTEVYGDAECWCE